MSDEKTHISFKEFVQEYEPQFVTDPKIRGIRPLDMPRGKRQAVCMFKGLFSGLLLAGCAAGAAITLKSNVPLAIKCFKYTWPITTVPSANVFFYREAMTGDPRRRALNNAIYEVQDAIFDNEPIDEMPQVLTEYVSEKWVFYASTSEGYLW